MAVAHFEACVARARRELAARPFTADCWRALARSVVRDASGLAAFCAAFDGVVIGSAEFERGDAARFLGGVMFVSDDPRWCDPRTARALLALNAVELCTPAVFVPGRRNVREACERAYLLSPATRGIIDAVVADGLYNLRWEAVRTLALRWLRVVAAARTAAADPAIFLPIGPTLPGSGTHGPGCRMRGTKGRGPMDTRIHHVRRRGRPGVL